MKGFLSQKAKGQTLPIVLGAVIICGVIGYGVYSQIQLSQENSNLKEFLRASEQNLTQVQNENAKLTQALNVANGTVDTVTGQVDELSGTIKKLNELDPELLNKYSKVYFLSDNYVPRGLVDIDSNYLLKPTKPLQVLTKVNEYLQQLMKISSAYGLKLEVLSAFRSFGTQSTLKSSYKFTYGAGTANQFSAEQGYSEHQLGTTVDFTTPMIGDTLSGFSETPEYKWLINNAYKYGFVLSYPPNNGYYTYEPWHWRFVGVELATRLHGDKQYFYDLEQRQIDPYLVKIFD